MDENIDEIEKDPAPDRAGEETAGRGRRARRRMLLIAAAGTLGVLAVTGGLLFGGGSGGNPSRQAATPSPTSTPVPGPAPGAAPTSGSEVPEPEATVPGGLPPVPEPTPMVEGPLPESGSATGELVDGFPEPVMTPMAASDVLDSSIAAEGEMMQATLVARSTASPDEIRDHYRTLWAGSGLSPTSGEGSDTAYTDASTSLTLAFTPGSGTGTVYVLYGVFRSH